MRVHVTDTLSARSFDDNGNLHVRDCNLTKEQVCGYLGKEINGGDLDPLKIYQVYRPASELAKPETLASFNGIPIQLQHHLDYPDGTGRQTRVGSTGDNARFVAPYVVNNLHIQDQRAIDHITDGSLKEISVGYSFVPVMQSGEWNGQHYDLMMTDIKANHIALVEQGRAGGDVKVADSVPQTGDSIMSENNSPVQGTTKDSAGELAAKIAALLEPILAAQKAQSADEGENAKDEDNPALPPKESADTVPTEGSPDVPTDNAEATDTASCADSEGETETKDDTAEKTAALVALGITPDKAAQLISDPSAWVHDENAAETKDSTAVQAEGESAVVVVPKTPAPSPVATADSLDAVKAEVSAHFKDLVKAGEECRTVLGNVSVLAFDSAEAIYTEALRKQGFKAPIAKDTARDVFMAYKAGQGAVRATAADKAPELPSGIMSALARVQKGY